MTPATGQRGRRPVVFGEVLFDRFPDGKAVLGGAPFNVAWNLQCLGAAPLLVSRVGNDQAGRRILDVMREQGMDTGGVQVDDDHATGSVDVNFEGGEPRYEIVDRCAYDFLSPEGFAGFEEAAFVYHGSLALRHEVTREAFERLIAEVPARRFLDVNLRTPWWRPGEVLELVRAAAWVKLNEHELTMLGMGDDPIEDLVRQYGLQALILTSGKSGARLVGADAELSVRPRPGIRVVDSVGAGDAFASVVLLGLLYEWPMQTTLDRAQAFASAVVGLRGATTRETTFYAGFRDAWTSGAASSRNPTRT